MEFCTILICHSATVKNPTLIHIYCMIVTLMTESPPLPLLAEMSCFQECGTNSVQFCHSATFKSCSPICNECPFGFWGCEQSFPPVSSVVLAPYVFLSRLPFVRIEHVILPSIQRNIPGLTQSSICGRDMLLVQCI
jgi:hypothetical protein